MLFPVCFLHSHSIAIVCWQTKWFVHPVPEGMLPILPALQSIPPPPPLFANSAAELLAFHPGRFTRTVTLISQQFYLAESSMHASLKDGIQQKRTGAIQALESHWEYKG